MKGRAGLFKVPSLVAALLFTSTALFAGEKAAGVGERTISDSDISYRVKIEEAYGNNSFSRNATLVSLVNDTIEREVARLSGVMVSVEEMNEFSRHADRSSKAPEILKKVKAVFGKDLESYRRIYIEPKILNRKLRYLYSRDRGVHSAEIRSIEEARSLVFDKRYSLKKAARKTGLEYAEREIAEKGHELPDALKQYSAEVSPGDPQLEILKTLKVGEVFKDVMENDHFYRIVRLLLRDGDKFKIESIDAKKRSFDEWYKEMASKIPVEIPDKATRDSLIKSYPGLWWIKQVRLGKLIDA